MVVAVVGGCGCGVGGRSCRVMGVQGRGLRCGFPPDVVPK